MNNGMAGFGYDPTQNFGMGMGPQQGMGMMSGMGMSQGSTPSQEVIGGVQVNPWLSAEDINMLRKECSQFTLSITNEELKRATCNHRDLNKYPSLKGEADGSCTCNICGYNFNVTEEYSFLQVEEACRIMENILQTIKLLYISIDPNVGKDFFQILAFIKKIPKLYEIASNDFKKYENVYGFTQGVPTNAFAIFGSLSSPSGFYNNSMGFNGQQMQGGPAQAYGQQAGQQMGNYGQQGGQQGNPFYQAQAPMYNNGAMGYTGQQQGQPMYGQQQQAPMYGQQQGQPMYGQQQQAPMYGQQQATTQTGFVMNPTGAAGPAVQQAAPQTPVAPATESPVSVGGEYKA